jgi:hypothetical protein
MLVGKNINELATALNDIRANAKDFLVPTAKLEMSDAGNLVFGTGNELVPTEFSHGQIATYSGIPKAYYEKIRSENPELFAKNVNHAFKRNTETALATGRNENRMVRTYKGNVRALLSASYRRLDSYDLAETVLPILVDKEMPVVSSEITDSRMYIKALSPKITTEIKKNDVVQYGLLISNSDVGAGCVRIEPLIYRLVCSNGLIMNTAIRKFHIGKSMAGDDITELLSNETINLSDAAFWAQVRDIVLASMNPENFEREVNRLREAANTPIKNFDIPEVVEMTMKAVGVNGDKTKDSIIAYLANGADGAGLTKWGLINGFTYAAHNGNASYDTAIDLERAGAKVLELNPNQWKRIADPVYA